MYQENNNRLNSLVNYIEEHLTEEIEYKKLAQILLVNEYTLHRIFYFVTNISLADYIRKRRLSMAAIDILGGKEKIIDIAVKYQYDSATAFSRAFKKMMGVSPSQFIGETKNINYFPVIKFEESEEELREIKFQIKGNVSFDMYVIGRDTTINDLSKTAKEFWEEMKNDRPEIFNEASYGVVEYDKFPSKEMNEATYYIGNKKRFKGSKKYNITNKKFLCFTINSVEGDNVSKFTKYIYSNILPNLGYNLDNVPDIEEYIDWEKTKIYIPII